MRVEQHQWELGSFPRGFHLITDRVSYNLPWLSSFEKGLLHLHLLHTSASLAINENADPDVRIDLQTIFDLLVPEGNPEYVHTIEGSDDMPAHAKSALLGPSLVIPIRGGRFALGTWQGIYLCEHRNAGGPRRIVATAIG